MLNIFGWRAYTLPVEGRPVKVSNRSQQVLVECNKRQGITYTQVNREVFLTFPLGDARHADGQCQMLYTKNETEDIEYFCFNDIFDFGRAGPSLHVNDKDKQIMSMVWTS